jgi:hypothetical protein
VPWGGHVYRTSHGTSAVRAECVAEHNSFVCSVGIIDQVLRGCMDAVVCMQAEYLRTVADLLGGWCMASILHVLESMHVMGLASPATTHISVPLEQLALSSRGMTM